MISVDFLKSIKILGNFTDTDFNLLSTFLEKREFQTGKRLILEGDNGGSLYFVEIGSVEVVMKMGSEEAVHIGEVTPGAIVGEMALFNGLKRAASVVANSYVKAWELSYENFEKLRKDDHSLAVKLQNAVGLSLSEKLTKTNLHLARLVAASRLITLGELSVDVMHEINSPLTVIRFLNEQIVEQAKDVPEKGEVILEKAVQIEKAFEHISKILKGVKLASRASGADSMEPVSLSEVVGDTARLFKDRLEKMKVGFEVIAPKGDSKIKCRPAQISQVLINLIGNACDAVEALSEKWIRVEVREYKNYFQMSVTDSGRGIPDDSRERIFEPFFSTKGVGKGTGIGLSLSRKIVESHHGRFFLDRSSPNTCFVVKLPKLIESGAPLIEDESELP